MWAGDVGCGAVRAATYALIVGGGAGVITATRSVQRSNTSEETHTSTAGYSQGAGGTIA